MSETRLEGGIAPRRSEITSGFFVGPFVFALGKAEGFPRNPGEIEFVPLPE